MFWIVTIFLLTGASVRAQQQGADGFVALFDGHSLQQWNMVEGHAGHWRAVDGIIDYDEKSEASLQDQKDLYTKRSYRDYIFKFEWCFPRTPQEFLHQNFLPDGGLARNPDGSVQRLKIMSAGDSGIFLRGAPESQVNLWCHPMGSGELHSLFMNLDLPVELRRAGIPSVNADKPFGQWNVMEITLIGDVITVVSNGITVLNKVRFPGLVREGPIGLQHHKDPVQFRNLWIKEL